LSPILLRKLTANFLNDSIYLLSLYEITMKEWSNVKKEFEIDGSLRDIYVEDVDSNIWNIFIGEVRRSPFRSEFTHGDRIVVLPDSIEIIKKMQDTDPTMLQIWIEDGLTVNCHFFMESEIELDVDPRDIQNKKPYMLLTGFMGWLSNLTGRAVKLTHEGDQNQVIVSVSSKNV